MVPTTTAEERRQNQFLFETISLPIGSVHEKVNLKNGRKEIVFDRLCSPALSILLLADIGAKLIVPHGSLQVDKEKFVM